MTWPPHQMTWHASKQVTSPPRNSRRLVHTKEMVCASRWSVALRTFYRQILSLLYSSFFLLKLPPPARPGTTCIYVTWSQFKVINYMILLTTHCQVTSLPLNDWEPFLGSVLKKTEARNLWCFHRNKKISKKKRCKIMANLQIPEELTAVFAGTKDQPPGSTVRIIPNHWCHANSSC